MMTEKPRQESWLSAITEAARQHGYALPLFTVQGMGSARSLSAAGGRFITFKRRLVRAAEAEIDGVEWTLWIELNDLPMPVAAFREPLVPKQENVAVALSLFKGWLLDGWTPEEAKAAVSRHPRCQKVVEVLARSNENNEYWLADDRDDRGFGIVVRSDRWGLYSRGKCLSSWRVKKDGAGDEYLDLASLDSLCAWVAKHWSVVAYGCDYRPAPIRGYPVAASRAYENAKLAHVTEKVAEVQSWWSRHAFRAAAAELPNVFLERQADDFVVSWDASPTPTRFYQVPAGEEVFSVATVVPTLRRLVSDRLRTMQLDPAQREDLLTGLSSDAAAGYAAAKHYNSSISDTWLIRHGFSDSDARELAMHGTSRHPVVGLLRSGQGSSITSADYDTLLRLLKPRNPLSFAKLLEFGKGLSSAVNPREPWESGYQLARFVRERLGFSLSEYIDIEAVVVQMGIETQDAELGDSTVLGVCVGTPGYAPLVVLNNSCADAIGVSGRRITLAHEFCHLLFDRAGLRSLARFEGAGADSDRLIEMRANAFAVELLVPMATLVGDDGAVVDDTRLREIAVEQQVSFHALEAHAKNLRDRLLGQS